MLGGGSLSYLGWMELLVSLCVVFWGWQRNATQSKTHSPPLPFVLVQNALLLVALLPQPVRLSCFVQVVVAYCFESVVDVQENLAAQDIDLG